MLRQWNHQMKASHRCSTVSSWTNVPLKLSKHLVMKVKPKPFTQPVADLVKATSFLGVMASLVPTLLHVYFSDREAGGDKARRIARQATQLATSASAAAHSISS